MNLKDMTNGWFIGNFDPAVLHTDEFEVGIKRYKAGQIDAKHYHKVAREITVVISGKVLMLDQRWDEGSIITIEPGVASSFEAITDAVLAVVKIPSALDDKFIIDE